MRAALVIGGVVLVIVLVNGQYPPGYTACSAERYRYCKSVDGIPAILSCLQEHRTVLSKACDAFLKEYGK